MFGNDYKIKTPFNLKKQDMKNKFPENKKLSIKYRCKEDGGVYSAEQASNMPNNHFRLITEKGKEIGEFVKWSDETN